MLAILSYSMNAVMPILLLILCGYAAEKLGYLDERTSAIVNRFNFRFGYFSMMCYNIYNMDIHKALPITLLGLTMGALVLLTLIGWVLSGVLSKERYRRGILIQSAFRSNYAIIGLMLAETLAGPEAVSLVAMVQLPAVVYFNVTSVIAMSVYSDSDQKPTARSVIMKMVKNPLLQGLALGALCVIVRMNLPVNADGTPVFTIQNNIPWLYTAFGNMSKMCSPLALIILGSNLRITQAREFMKELVSGVIMRLIMSPIVGLGILLAADHAGLVKLTPIEVSMLISVFGSPLATATAIMAREMGADKDLAGQLVVWTSIFSMPTMFISVSILRGMGLL